MPPRSTCELGCARWCNRTLLVINSPVREGSGVTVPPVLAVEILMPSSRGTDLVRKPEVLDRSGEERFAAEAPFPVSFRPSDLAR